MWVIYSICTFSIHTSNFNENGKKVNANNADFEYAVAGFRAFKHLGVSFGILPYSNVGYNYAIADIMAGAYSFITS